MNPPLKIYDKKPLSFHSQVLKLQSRGLIINDFEQATFYLSKINYYRLAAYCLAFEVDHATHTFKSGTTFEDVLNLYQFDRELRLLMMDAIDHIEVSLRTQLAYHLSHRHHNAHPHLNAKLFYNQRHYQNGLQKLERDVLESREDFIKHFKTKYVEATPPIWAAVELMSMGQLSKWYANIADRQDRQAICQDWAISEKVATSFCEHLSLVRNICAHHGRLWNREFAIKMMLPRNVIVDLKETLLYLDDADKRLRKIYNTLCMVLHILNRITANHDWQSRIRNLITLHQIDTRKMGFPDDWLSRPLWKPATN